jgi:Mrp family chromosome partitioning ATPase
MMDGVVMVVKAEGVRGEIVMRMKDLLLEINARILGAVLNKRRFYIPGWLYRRL